MTRHKTRCFLLCIVLTCTLFSFANAQQQYFDNSAADDDDFGDFDNEDEEFVNVKPKRTSNEAFHERQEIKDDPLEQNGITGEEAELPEPELVMADINDDDDVTIESEDEFSHFNDEEEFIGYSSDGSPAPGGSKQHQRKDGVTKEPKITIADVPLHLRSNWDSYYLELILIAFLLVYFTNFNMGRNKNLKLATAWFDTHKSLLVQQFALVGDDGKAASDSSNNTSSTANGSSSPSENKSLISSTGGCAGLQKESENIYTLYCSGRSCVHSMMVELRFMKRQDLASVMLNLFRPSSDEIIIKLRLDDMDSFVMCLAAKKVANKYVKEMTDITTYCPGERKTTLPSKVYNNSLCSKYVVWSEISEACQAIFGEQKTAAVLNKHLHRINYIHISDQYAGAKQPDQDQQQVSVDRLDVQKMPEVHKMLIVSMQLNSGTSSGDGSKSKGSSSSMTATPSAEEMESLRLLMMLVLHLTDKLYRFKLSKESKTKAIRNRSRVEEAFHKATHAARAERAQGIREEKKREQREKIMESDDPDKQRKWEERENKKAAKKKFPKTKQLKMA